MQWMGLNEIREKFLSFYESKGHTRLPSFPLVPQDDNSLLLINSGMAPMKKYFLGVETPPSKRVTTCQKCIRTPDIERVGKTSRHGTFFEMLGNFSFGDYFKEDATTWAWEFVTQVMQLPVERIYVSIYENDDEAFEIWTKRRGVDPSHIVRLGKEDNFWEIGSGPCGPCSEIYFDRGEGVGCGRPDCAVGCDCDRFVEFWNLVFTQFNSDGEGNYTPLEHPNIDTGMGLERLACILQGVDNLFEVDTVQNIMQHICRIAGVQYKQNDKTDVSLRVITDHIRSTVFMVGDGVTPQNEGRGYVLRRLLRRAARHGRLLGINEPFLYKVASTVIGENASAYPELRQNEDYIVKIIQVEEERFEKTINQGVEMLMACIDRFDSPTYAQEERKIPGEQVFKLYDTFGFPIDLTREIAEERGLAIDDEGFEKLMELQRQRARDARANLETISWKDDVLTALGSFSETFTGYEGMQGESVVKFIVREDEGVDVIREGDKAAIILESTPFYAESGGQVGDTGVLAGKGFLFTVLDCKKSPTGHYMHIGVMTEGVLSVGDTVTAQVAERRRMSIMRNHSACHLLQAALREVLGSHVHQAGSYVDESRCRFDFSHFAALSPEELERVELLVNEMIFAALPIHTEQMPLEEAKKTGAMALFGEKYADIVRVVNMGGRSIEFCGGTHMDNTAKIGLFKIVSESSVAAGVRRIEAVTGYGVLGYIREQSETLTQAAAALKLGSPAELVSRIGSLTAELKAKEKELEENKRQAAGSQIDALLEKAVEVDGLKVIVAHLKDAKPESLRAMGDAVKQKLDSAVAVFIGEKDGKTTVVTSSGKEAVSKGAHAGQLIKAITSLTGGSGGGRPDGAMGGIADSGKVAEALSKVPEMVKGLLRK